MLGGKRNEVSKRTRVVAARLALGVLVAEVILILLFGWWGVLPIMIFVVLAVIAGLMERMRLAKEGRLLQDKKAQISGGDE